MPKETVEEFLARGGKIKKSKGPKAKPFGTKEAEKVVNEAKKRYRVVSSSGGKYLVWANPEMYKESISRHKKAISANIKKRGKKGLLGLGIIASSIGSSIKEAMKE